MTKREGLKNPKRAPDKGEVGGSSPPRPTITINSKYGAILTFPFRGLSLKKPICQLFANFRIGRMALHRALRPSRMKAEWLASIRIMSRTLPYRVEGRGRQCKALPDCARSGKSFLVS